MGVYDDLLAWSVGRPNWQRDALRRLVTTGPLQDADLAQLTRVALTDVGWTDEALEAIALSATDLPTETGAGSDVRLGAISAPENVNAIAPDARLVFEPTGLTVIYGDNGSGKSGYVRILKRVCRTRGTPERVLPNVLNPVGRPTSAVIDFLVGDEARTRVWALADALADELGAVTVFDRACAAVYVDSENEVAYRPLGLDLLDGLAQAARSVRQRLESRRDSTAPHPLSPPVDLLQAPALVTLWPPEAEITSKDIETAAAWSDEASRTLARLERTLAAPAVSDSIAGLSARRAELARSRRLCAIAVAAVAAATELPTATGRLEAAEEAVREARETALGATDMPGVGGVLWRALWVAAERYSVDQVYPGQQFPNVLEDARCVLCGQLLALDSRVRFQALRAMVEHELGHAVQTARDQLADLRASLDGLLALEPVETSVADLQAIDPEAHERVSAYLTAVIARAEAAATATSGPEDPVDPDVSVDPSQWLQERIGLLEADLTVMQRASVATEVEAMRIEARDLRARRWVHDNTSSIVAEQTRRRTSKAIAQALVTCDTNPITTESSRLTVRYVTEALRGDFARELEGLNPSRVGVRIIQRGAYGLTYYRLELKGPPTDARVSEVVSDGEFRAIALANFFAEIAHSSTRSAIVLDDPVTSLDHLYRDRVAARLVQEADRRQVIVFTHDLVFLHDLATMAEHEGVPIGFRSLVLTTTHVGWPLASLPWAGMKVSQRLDALQTDLNGLRQVYDAGDLESYGRGAERWYARLRSTWERAVEEILFVDAIGRYRSEVKTNNLTSNRVWVLDQGDVEELAAGMTKSSNWIDAHDHPAAVNRHMPLPDELRDDLKAFQDWVARMKEKRKP